MAGNKYNNQIENTAISRNGSSSGNSQQIFMPGLIIDDYEVQSTLATTTCSEVARAIDGNTGESVVLKAPRTPAVADFIENEVAVLDAIGSHPHIVSKAGTGILSNGLPYVATWLLEGGTLKHVINKIRSSEQPLNEDELIRNVRQLYHCALGIDAVHAAGFVHGDIKPDNVCLDRDDSGVLIDFGVATEPTNGLPNIYVRGTPGQSISPEGYRGEVGFESDIWALGATSMRVMTGRPAFEEPVFSDKTWSKRSSEYLRVVRNGPHRQPRDLNGLVPNDINEIVTAALNPYPEDRPTLKEIENVYAAYSDAA